MLYLDYNATTPVDPRVADAMLPFLKDNFGNPSSGHSLGQKTRSAIDKSRAQTAALLEAQPDEIIFTSSGTESNNHAIMGSAFARRQHGNHIITSVVEHPAVTEVCRHLESHGFCFTEVPVDSRGLVRVRDVAEAITPQTILVTIMRANNEVGTLQPIAEIAQLAKQHDILTHSDCAQAVGKIPVSCKDLGVDMISVAGHKLYGPKGVGLLFVRSGLEIPNLMHGAGHENGRRPGTENILEIVGLGKACQLVAEDVDQEFSRLWALRNQMAAALLAEHPEAKINGHPELCLPNTLSISFPDLRADDLMAAMPNVAVSAGAACHGGGPVASRVLTAMDVPERWALGTLRVSLGRMTTDSQAEQGVLEIVNAVRKVRNRNQL